MSSGDEHPCSGARDVNGEIHSVDMYVEAIEFALTEIGKAFIVLIKVCIKN